jgi:phosphotransferase system enzyme I (PtsI)
MGQQTVKGIGASAGIAIGKAFVLPAWEWDIPEKNIDVTELAGEFERLYQGIRRSRDEIEGMKREMSGIIGEENSFIFDAHLAILDDPEFVREVQDIIRRQYKAAEVAVKEVIDQFVSMFDMIDDEYMKERSADIRDVGNRLLHHLLGTPAITLPSDNQPFILVTKEISPSQLANLNPERVLGVVTMIGGRNSHAAIMARSMGIPLVISLEDQLIAPIQTGEELIVDGDRGLVIIRPDDAVRHQYEQRRRLQQEHRRKLHENRFAPSVTKDGVPLTLLANISSQKELDAAMEDGAEGVGLFRTEFLYMDRDAFPDEEEQFAVYREAAEKLGEKPLAIRTLDIGGDKVLDYCPFPEEENPYLGYRAIRFSLDRRDVFKTQIRAILRAGLHGNVKLLLPMISSMEEWWAAMDVLREAERELAEAGIPYRSGMDVGVMIEVPAAVLIAGELAKEAAFFSIGTNDLIQYVLAVDRMNDHIAHLYDPFHPAVLRMIKMAVDAAKKNGIGVSVCGEMAGDPEAAALLVGLGITHLSMSARSLLVVKDRLSRLESGECAKLAKRLMKCKTGKEAADLNHRFLEAAIERGSPV